MNATKIGGLAVDDGMITSNGTHAAPLIQCGKHGKHKLLYLAEDISNYLYQVPGSDKNNLRSHITSLVLIKRAFKSTAEYGSSRI